MFFRKKNFLFTLIPLLVVLGIYLGSSLQTSGPYGLGSWTFASSIQPGDEPCEASPPEGRGGTCMHGYSDTGVSCNNDMGIIIGELCMSRPGDMQYRCCVPTQNVKDSDEGGNTDKACVDRGGICMDGYPNIGVSCNDNRGIIVGGLCMSKPGDMQYRCCVPIDDDEDEIEEPDRVRSDAACDYIGGRCEWTDNPFGNCTVNGNPGCYIVGACRADPHSIREGQYYVCCTDDEEFCGGGVDYTKWNDVFPNEDCPFSKPSESEDRLWCSQGPETTPSHHRVETKPSVDITITKDGSPGSEYFIAPDDGVIEEARAFYAEGSEKCGCYMKFVTDGGVTYEIRHCFLFAGIGQYYNQNTGKPMQNPLRVSKGEVLARIADESDTQVIDHAGGCSSGPHFHVYVEGGDVDRCVDCYFVDKLGCNLFNDGSRASGNDYRKGDCGRCYRENFPTDCWSGGRVADWGGVKCDDECAGCNTDPVHYCCETDKVWCCVGPPAAQICNWVCDCPHPSP